MSIRKIFKKIYRLTPLHTCKVAELDYYSDAGSCYSCSFGRHCDEPKAHAESMRGVWFGQGDRCWAFYCKVCGKCVQTSYYIEAMKLINSHNTEIEVK